jgi:hypothetical protein
MENENLIEIKIKCETCKEPFETLFVVKDGKPYDYCCSIKCYNEYHSIENIRDRKIKSIIN